MMKIFRYLLLSGLSVLATASLSQTVGWQDNGSGSSPSISADFAKQNNGTISVINNLSIPPEVTFGGVGVTQANSSGAQTGFWSYTVNGTYQTMPNVGPLTADALGNAYLAYDIDDVRYGYSYYVASVAGDYENWQLAVGGLVSGIGVAGGNLFICYDSSGGTTIECIDASTGAEIGSSTFSGDSCGPVWVNSDGSEAFAGGFDSNSTPCFVIMGQKVSGGTVSQSSLDVTFSVESSDHHNPTGNMFINGDSSNDVFLSSEDTFVYESGPVKETVITEAKFGTFSSPTEGWQDCFHNANGDNIPGPIAINADDIYGSSYGYYGTSSLGNQVYSGLISHLGPDELSYEPGWTSQITAMVAAPYLRVLVSQGAGGTGGLYSYSGGSWSYTSTNQFGFSLDEDSSGNCYLFGPYLMQIH